jgi:hypothetical protein
MGSLLDKDMKRQKEGGKREERVIRVQNGLPVRSPKLRGPKLGPCLAWVRRMQKAAAKDARFGGHVTQIVTFSACSSQ